MILFYAKDIFLKGLNNVDVDDKNHVINCNYPLNKVCLDNFTDKDIILNIRNALAHNSNDLSEIEVSESELKILVGLKNTIASKGPNIGQNIPFKVEFDVVDLLQMSSFCAHYAQTMHITGVNFNPDTVTDNTNTDIFEMLKEIVNTTYYEYTLFNQIANTDRYKLWQNRGNKNFDTLAKKFIKKSEKIELSQNQRNCIFSSMMRKLKLVLSSLGLGANEKWSVAKTKRILGIFFKEYYEYEALKVIPMGREKYNTHLISILLNCYHRLNESIDETQIRLIHDLLNDGNIMEIFKVFNQYETEEVNMFAKSIFDSNNLAKEADSIYYNYVFEKYIPAGEKVLIDGVLYESNRIRNSLTHGRWYFDEDNDNWKLFDNSDSLKKADQYRYDWEATIPSYAFRSFVDQYYETVKEGEKNNNIAII